MLPANIKRVKSRIWNNKRDNLMISLRHTALGLALRLAFASQAAGGDQYSVLALMEGLGKS